jgi:hypothetical protein
MWDPKTRGVHSTRDNIWLHRMHFPKAERVAMEIAPAGDLLMPEPVLIIKEEENEMEADPKAGEGTGNGNAGTGEEAPEESSKETPTVLTTDYNEELEERINSEPMMTTTRSGRAVRAPAWLADYEIRLTAVEVHYNLAMKSIEQVTEATEVGCVGAGIGGGFVNTSQLVLILC